MHVNKHTFFCRHLASWLYHSPWNHPAHFKACAKSIDPLPSDSHVLLDDLLNHFAIKPDEKHIVNFLENHPTIRHWFSLDHPPRLINFNLEQVKTDPKNGAIDSVDSLAHWLGLSYEQLEWFSNKRRSNSLENEKLTHYHYNVHSKNTGGLRLIESPKIQLKAIQQKIHRNILVNLAVHESAHGFQQNKSCYTHASLHVNKPYVFLFDIANCFQSIQWPKVYHIFLQAHFSKPVANYLAHLCTHRCNPQNQIIKQLSTEQQQLLKSKHLPQGAPSSPSLSNAAFYQLDKRLAGLAKYHGFNYSRYADDLVFSGDRYRDKYRLATLVDTICHEEGFRLNPKKTRLLKANQRQQITGIVVNQKINISRTYYDHLKAILNNSLKYGLESQNREQDPYFREQLIGKIAYVKSLNRHRGEKLEKMLAKIP